MSAHIPNRQLTSAQVPPPDADFAETIYPFAMRFHGYEVWGDFETVRDIAERTWAARERTQSLPNSLTKLRTSLFGAARYMRMTDFDEDITGRPGSEADWIAMMRDHVAAIARLVEQGPSPHLTMAVATSSATAAIGQLPEANEQDLRIALGRALAEILSLDFR